MWNFDPQFHMMEFVLLLVLLLDLVLRLVWQGIRSFLSHRNIFVVSPLSLHVVDNL